MRTAKEGNPFRVQNSELQRWAIGSLACTQVIMFDLGVEEEVIIIDIESDITDNSNINTAPRAGAGGDPLDGNGNDDDVVGGRKHGRQGSDLWSLYIDDVNPHQRKSAVYKHCRMLVNHHKKSESVKVHLNKCAPFRKLMNGMEEDKRPAWYTAKKKPRKPLSTECRCRCLQWLPVLLVSAQSRSSPYLLSANNRRCSSRNMLQCTITPQGRRFSESKTFIWLPQSRPCALMTVCSPTEDNWRPLCSTPATRMSKPRSLRA